jgi:hypothetical protein
MTPVERNVLSFRAALVKGHQPSQYSYDAARIPLGDIDALLDFKTWSRRIIAINAYFTNRDTCDQFVVTVYCHNKTGRYTVAGSVVDFGQCTVGGLYRVRVALKEANGKRRVTLTKAEQIE